MSFAHEIATMLAQLLAGDPYVLDDLDAESAVTFEEAMLVTSDAGVVLRLAEGAEYQLTVVRSR